MDKTRWTSCWAGVVATILVAAWPCPSWAQSQVAYRDGDGQWQWTEVGGRRGIVPKRSSTSETIVGMFKVTFEDILRETGVGFDDPVSGAARRETLRAVLLYVSSVLDAAGTADLFVLASQTGGNGPLASAGPYLMPVTGFQGGLVYEHLVTGVDPLAGTPDGTVAVDFGYRWSSGTDPPSKTEFDLYTVLLHEVTHALGFFSVAGADGRSALLNIDDAGLFSLYDAFLVRESTGRFLYLEGGKNNSTRGDVTSRDVAFAGARAEASFGERPPVFAPNPFLEGSSIGHWSPTTGDDVVMRPDLEPGAVRREYKGWELQTLGDLGYEVVVCGDGFTAGFEECDDGNFDDADECDSSCRFVPEPVADAGIPDAGVPDASLPDAGLPDASLPDAGLLDAGLPGVGVPDASLPDAMVDEEEPPRPTLIDRGDEPPAATALSPSEGACNVQRSDSRGAWLSLLLVLLATLRTRRSRGAGSGY